MVFLHDFSQFGDNEFLVQTPGSLVKVFQEAVQYAPVTACGASNLDFLMSGRLTALLGSQQFLVKFLTRTQTGEYDVNILVGGKAGKTNQFLRQLQDPDRLPHIKQEDLPPAPMLAAWSTSCTASGIVMK